MMLMRLLALVSVITVAIAGLNSNAHHQTTGEYNQQCENNIFDHPATILPKVIGIPLQYQAGFPGVLSEISDNEEADKKTPNTEQQNVHTKPDKFAKMKEILEMSLFDEIKLEWETDVESVLKAQNAIPWKWLETKEAQLADEIEEHFAYQILQDLGREVNIETLKIEIMLCLFNSLIIVKNGGTFLDSKSYMSLATKQNTRWICSKFMQAWSDYQGEILDNAQYEAVWQKLAVLERMGGFDYVSEQPLRLEPTDALKELTRYMKDTVEKRREAVASRKFNLRERYEWDFN